MIPIVEDYLSELIESKLLYLKTNPDHIDKILGASQVKLDRLKQYIQTNPVKVVRGYPRDAAMLPAICILLSGEEETQEGLGDYGEDEDSDVRTFTEELEVTSTEGARLPIPYVQTSYKPVVAVTEIVHNDFGTTLQAPEYGIHNESLGLVGLYNGMAEHGDTMTVSYSYRASAETQLATMFESNYRLECWTENGDLTVELYHILKWALLSGRDHLGSDRDLFRQRTSGADFEPAPSFFPTFVYRRALSYWCQFSVTVPDEEVDYITGTEINQTVYIDTEGSDQ